MSGTYNLSPERLKLGISATVGEAITKVTITMSPSDARDYCITLGPEQLDLLIARLVALKEATHKFSELFPAAAGGKH